MGTRSKMQQNRFRTAFQGMASFLLKAGGGRRGFASYIVLAGRLMLSCLSPQTIEQTPPVSRQAPVIQLNSVLPEPRVCVTADMPASSFTLTVSSPDGGSLHARWFVDYDEDKHVTDFVWDEPLNPLPDAAEGPVSFVAEVDMVRTHMMDKPGVHGLEVVIATSFSPDLNATPTNRALADGAFATSFKWVVDTSGTGTCK